MRGLIRAHFNCGNENFKLAPFELLSLKSPFDGHTGDGATNNDLIKVGDGEGDLTHSPNWTFNEQISFVTSSTIKFNLQSKICF